MIKMDSTVLSQKELDRFIPSL
jgi:hypothetical protein